jgi:hypothetical protein
MKYESEFFEESCLECFQPCNMCSEIEKMKCYIDWADEKINENKNELLIAEKQITELINKI